MTDPQRRRPEGAARLTKAERRRQLLGHARQLFLDQGYSQTTLEQVAAAAGVTETVLQRHFPTRASFLVEMLRQLREATLDRWQADTAATADPLARLHAIADLYLGECRVRSDDGLLLHRLLAEGGDEETTAALRAFYLEWEAFLARIIAEGQQSGVFRRSLDPRVGAWELIGSAIGYVLTRPLDVPLHAEPDYLPRAVECLLHCLLKTDV